MKTKPIIAFIGTVVLAVGLLGANNADATVRIRFKGVDICFTGKKNPHGCDSAVARNRQLQVVVLEDDAMAKMDKMQGQKIKIEAVAAERIPAVPTR